MAVVGDVSPHRLLAQLRHLQIVVPIQSVVQEGELGIDQVQQRQIRRHDLLEEQDRLIPDRGLQIRVVVSGEKLRIGFDVASQFARTEPLFDEARRELREFAVGNGAPVLVAPRSP